MDKLWKAHWIVDEDFYGIPPINVFHKENDKKVLPEHKPDLKNRHMLVRKTIHIDENIDTAILDITADDYYKLYINGRFVGQGPASSYYFHYYYNRYDVSSFLKKGANTIAIHVYYQGLINRVWNSGDYRQGMIAELTVNGSLKAASDSSWRYKLCKAYKTAETISYDTQYTEHIDGRLMEYGWKDNGYDDSGWHPCCETYSDDHKLFLQPTPPLQVYERKPAHVVKVGEGRYFIDFGEEVTGQFKMSAAGHEGDVIELRCGEELLEGSSCAVRYEMRSNCNYREYWTLSGKGRETLEHYDYKVFRYIEVLGSEAAIDSSSFCAVVRHYPLDEAACSFTSSDELLNSIWNICKNGVRYGSQEVFVDCPGREKGQYLGDGTVTAHSHIYVSGDLRLFHKFLQDFSLSSFIDPGLMAVAPGSLMQEIADYSLQWPMQLVNYYMHSGDLSFLQSMYPAAERMLQYFKGFERADGLLENMQGKWNLVDWPANLRDDYDFALSQPEVGEGCHNVINAFYIGCLQYMNKIRDILGISYTNRVPALTDAFLKAFYDGKEGLFRDSTASNHFALHSNMLPLLFDLIPEGRKGAILGFIRSKRISCGVYMSYFLLKALSHAGEHELLYELLTCTDEQSWGNMVREGATTCFEAWGKDQKWNTSLCHPWASAPVVMLIEDVFGIKPASPGWGEVCFDPHIPASLKQASLSFKTIKGVFKAEYHDGKAELTVPEGVKIR